MAVENSKLLKLKYALPWLARYPFSRARDLFSGNTSGKTHVIFTVANHFEPSWKAGGMHNIDAQRRRMDEWHAAAERIGDAVRDADGTKFRHTAFYPAEQYDRRILENLSEMQRKGLGEIEIHLHHGLERPDTEDGLRRSLVEFRDLLAGEHRCLSRASASDTPKYAFVHGNLALANSHGGKYCGVDSEMRILHETGCYADMTLPSAPNRTQVPMLNRIYECGKPLDEKLPHRTGTDVRVGGRQPSTPLIFTGPLVFNWTRRVKGIPVPRLDDGGLVHNQPMDIPRFERWRSANIIVRENPQWVFVKLYCHGFFDHDQSACIGEEARRFFSEVIEHGERTGAFSVYFATAREAFNMVAAAIDGKSGSPGQYRDHKLRPILTEGTI